MSKLHVMEQKSTGKKKWEKPSVQTLKINSDTKAGMPAGKEVFNAMTMMLSNNRS